MKEWLQDKKNQPIVIGVSVLALVAVIVVALFVTGVLGGSSQGTPVAVAPGAGVPPAPGPGGPPSPGAPGSAVPSAMGGAPGQPGPRTMTASGMPRRPGMPHMSAPGGPAKIAVAKKAGAPPNSERMASMPRGKYDPFLPAYAVAKLIAPPPPVVDIASIGSLTNYVPALPGATGSDVGGVAPAPTEAALPANLGHVSGIINSNGIHAIYEVNGNATIVQPGDQLPDGQGKVVAIQASSITVHLAASDRDVDIPVTQGDTPATGAAPTPGGPPGQFGQPAPNNN